MPSMPTSTSRPRRATPATAIPPLAKVPTGIDGFDEITGGGLPRGPADAGLRRAGLRQDPVRRSSSWSAARRARRARRVHDLRGDRARSWLENVASLGFDLDELIAQKRLAIDYVRVERSEIEETGEYDLEGLFIRLDHAIALDRRQARRARHDRVAVRRAEQRRRPARRAAAAVPLAQGPRHHRGHHRRARRRPLTRQGLEEYVSDCVILLDHRVNDQISTRRLRIVKYRGSSHGTNEYPFLIDERGIAVLPVTSLQLMHAASSERVSTGLALARRDARRQGLLPRQQRAASRAAPARRRPASPRTSSTPPAAAASGPCTFSSRSRRRSTCATCARSASTSSAG